MKIRVAMFWVVSPCSDAEDGGSMNLGNVDIYHISTQCHNPEDQALFSLRLLIS